MKNERLTIRIESTAKESLKKIADNKNTTMSNIIEGFVNKCINNSSGKEAKQDKN